MVVVISESSCGGGIFGSPAGLSGVEITLSHRVGEVCRAIGGCIG
jgi:hypothetical protein